MTTIFARLRALHTDGAPLSALIEEACEVGDELVAALDSAAGCIEGAVGVYDQTIPLNTLEEFAGVPIAAIRRLMANARLARAELARAYADNGHTPTNGARAA